MPSIASIKKQIANLEKQAVFLRKAATASVVAKLKAMIARHGLTAEDLGLAGRPAKTAKPAATRVARVGKDAMKASVKTRAKPGPRKTAGVPRYQDPKTGKTWTGNGKAPAWIAGATQRDAFLIATETAVPVAPKKAPKAAPQASADAAAPKAARAKRAAKPLRPDFGTVVRPAPSGAAAPAPAAAKRGRRSAKVDAPVSVAAEATESPSTPA